MPQGKLPTILALPPLAALLLAGCCCPALSGRYYESPPPILPQQGICGASNCGCSPGRHPLLAHHGDGLAGLRHSLGLFEPTLNRVPTQQHADYVSPLPKFHPVPTRPVFEPQPIYPPLELLDPAVKSHVPSPTAAIGSGG